MTEVGMRAASPACGPESGGEAVRDDTEEVEILATEQRSDGRPGAQLTRVNGKLMCHCPYLCGATGEKCAFDGTEWDPRR